MQNRKWQAQEEALDLRLRENSRAKRLEWANFAEHPNGKDVPTTMVDEDLAQEMIFVHEIDDDSASNLGLLEDESQSEDADVDAATRLIARTRGKKRSHAVVSKGSSRSGSNSGEESFKKHRIKNNDIQRKLAESAKTAHDCKTGRRFGPPNSSIQQGLAGLSRAGAGDLDDDESNDADDERESSEESDDAEYELDEEPTRILGDDDP
jgi:hypothetical protein